MKIRFDENQQYQLDAINAVVDLFEGQPLAAGAYTKGTKDELKLRATEWAKIQ